jgi:hypothetical protein
MPLPAPSKDQVRADESGHDTIPVRLSFTTRDRLGCIAKKNAVSMDEVVQAGLDAFESKCGPAYGLLSVDLVRSIDMLEASTAFLTQANFVVAECLVGLQQDDFRKAAILTADEKSAALPVKGKS